MSTISTTPPATVTPIERQRGFASRGTPFGPPGRQPVPHDPHQLLEPEDRQPRTDDGRQEDDGGASAQDQQATDRRSPALPARAGDPSRGPRRSPRSTPPPRGVAGRAAHASRARQPPVLRRRACLPVVHQYGVFSSSHTATVRAPLRLSVSTNDVQTEIASPSTTSSPPEAATAQPIRGATLRRFGARSTPPITQSSDINGSSQASTLTMWVTWSDRAAKLCEPMLDKVTSRPGGR